MYHLLTYYQCYSYDTWHVVSDLLCRSADCWRGELHLSSEFVLLHHHEASANHVLGSAACVPQTRARLWVPVLLWAPDVLPARPVLSAGSVQSGQRSGGGRTLHRLRPACSHLGPPAPEVLGQGQLLTPSSPDITRPIHNTGPAHLRSRSHRLPAPLPVQTVSVSSPAPEGRSSRWPGSAGRRLQPGRSVSGEEVDELSSAAGAQPHSRGQGGDDRGERGGGTPSGGDLCPRSSSRWEQRAAGWGDRTGQGRAESCPPPALWSSCSRAENRTAEDPTFTDLQGPQGRQGENWQWIFF